MSFKDLDYLEKKILKSIEECSAFDIKHITEVYKYCKSFDNTIAILKHSKEFNTALEESNKKNLIPITLNFNHNDIPLGYISDSGKIQERFKRNSQYLSIEPGGVIDDDGNFTIKEFSIVFKHNSHG